MSKKKHSFSILLDTETHNAVIACAGKEDRSKANICSVLIKEALAAQKIKKD